MRWITSSLSSMMRSETGARDGSLLKRYVHRAPAGHHGRADAGGPGRVDRLRPGSRLLHRWLREVIDRHVFGRALHSTKATAGDVPVHLRERVQVLLVVPVVEILLLLRRH